MVLWRWIWTRVISNRNKSSKGMIFQCPSAWSSKQSISSFSSLNISQHNKWHRGRTKDCPSTNASVIHIPPLQKWAHVHYWKQNKSIGRCRTATKCWCESNMRLWKIALMNVRLTSKDHRQHSFLPYSRSYAGRSWAGFKGVNLTKPC